MTLGEVTHVPLYSGNFVSIVPHEARTFGAATTFGHIFESTSFEDTMVCESLGVEIQIGGQSHFVDKKHVQHLIDALYAAQGLEVIPLRDELIAFATFNDPDGQYVEEVVDDYLGTLKDEEEYQNRS